MSHYWQSLPRPISYRISSHLALKHGSLARDGKVIDVEFFVLGDEESLSSESTF